jgi:hypothetical protein
MNPYSTAMEFLATKDDGGKSPPFYLMIVLFAAYALCWWLAFGETSPLRNKLGNFMQVMVLLVGPALLIMPAVWFFR